MRHSTLIKLFAFCLLMLVIRAFRTEHYSFFFLLWNLFLAVLPYGFITQYSNVKTPTAKGFLIVLSILFLPNAPYLVTDLFHLTKNLAVPMWFDLVLILNFSLFGLCLFVITIDQIFKILESLIKSRMHFNVVKFLILLSNGYGIYLGRYLRFNSWDVLSNPDDLALQMFYSVFNSNNYKETLGVTFTFTIFLYLVYEIYESFKRKEEAKQNELL